MNMEKIKVALLGVIALTLIVNTYLQSSGGKSNFIPPSEVPQSNVVTSNSPVQQGQVNPIANPITNQPNPQANNQLTPPITQPAQPAGPSTSVKFENYKHDFGNIKQNSENTKVFKFTNTGTEDMIIADAKGSCGCTVPNYPKEPIPPGGIGEIEVTYRPGTQKAQQNKTVTVTANTEPAQTILTISAFVEEEGS